MRRAAINDVHSLLTACKIEGLVQQPPNGCSILRASRTEQQSAAQLVVGVCLRLRLEAPLTADLPSPAVSKLYRNPPFSSSDSTALAAWRSKTLLSADCSLTLELVNAFSN